MQLGWGFSYFRQNRRVVLRISGGNLSLPVKMHHFFSDYATLGWHLKILYIINLSERSKNTSKLIKYRHFKVNNGKKIANKEKKITVVAHLAFDVKRSLRITFLPTFYTFLESP